MSSWLTAFAARLAGGPSSKRRSEEISEIFYKQSLYANTEAFLSDLLAIFPEAQALETADLALLIENLCGYWGAQKALAFGELDAHTNFWRELAARTGSPQARVCYGDALFCAGARRDAIAVFAEALQEDAELVAALDDEHFRAANELAPAPQLVFKLAVLRARLATGADAEDDSSRELYSELLEDFAADPAAIKQIRTVGEALEAAVRSGTMPRALVRRRTERNRS